MPSQKPRQASAHAGRSGSAQAVLLVAVAYVVALVVAGITVKLSAAAHPIWQAAAANLVGTFVVFGFSRAFNNSSFYDPYWSLAPIALATHLAFGPYAHDGIAVRKWVVIVVVVVWGSRLTFNWLRGFGGLRHEDWRYVELRTKLGKAYWPISFFGIHLFPTACIFAGSLSLFPAMASARPMSWLDALGAAIALFGTALESVADRQLYEHRQASKTLGQDRILETGVWRYSRHPNYFGECLFWTGLFVIGISADPSSISWSSAGPVTMFALFQFISIPLMERRSLATKPGFAARQRNVSALLPWFPKSEPRAIDSE